MNLTGKRFNCGRDTRDNPIWNGIIIREEDCHWECNNRKACYRKQLVIIYPDFLITYHICALKKWIEGGEENGEIS